MDGSVGTETVEPTCSYYISRSGTNTFVEAECKDSSPCRGFCKDLKTIIRLDLKNTYDIKVLSHGDNGHKTYPNIYMSTA